MLPITNKPNLSTTVKHNRSGGIKAQSFPSRQLLLQPLFLKLSIARFRIDFLTEGLRDFLDLHEYVKLACMNRFWFRHTQELRSYYGVDSDGFVNAPDRYLRDFHGVSSALIGRMKISSHVLCNIFELRNIKYAITHPCATNHLRHYLIEAIRASSNQSFIVDQELIDQILAILNQGQAKLGRTALINLIDHLILDPSDGPRLFGSQSCASRYLERLLEDLNKVLDRHKKKRGTLDISLKKYANRELPSLAREMPDKSIEIGIEAIHRAKENPTLKWIVARVIYHCQKKSHKDQIQLLYRSSIVDLV